MNSERLEGTTMASGTFGIISIRVSPGAGLEFSCGFQDLLQFQDSFFGNKHSGLAMRLGVVTIATRVMGHGLAFHIELEPEFCDPRFSPKPKRGLADAADDFRSLVDVEVTLSVVVDKGRVLSSHPQTKQDFGPNFKRSIGQGKAGSGCYGSKAAALNENGFRTQADGFFE